MCAAAGRLRVGVVVVEAAEVGVEGNGAAPLPVGDTCDMLTLEGECGSTMKVGEVEVGIFMPSPENGGLGLAGGYCPITVTGVEPALNGPDGMG